jgi:tetratricopeptide (TPR) repeat protein/DNA-binding transcriptional ArsR family regulator
MSRKVFLSRFTPSRTDPEILERIFVQREALAKDAEERLRECAESGNMHHLLFIGPRGSGKSHLVSLIFHRLVSREELNGQLRVAWLAEDETTTSFLKLLLRIYRALAQRYPDEFSHLPPTRLQELDETGRAKLVTELLLESLRGRALLVVVENLDELFKGLGDDGEKQWRAFLQENPCSATLATSQQLFDGVSRRQSPFFGFFQIEYLRPLAFEQAVLLLRKIADLKGDTDLAAFLQTRQGHSRVRALHHLSGGNHRVYIILSDFITRESLDELVGPFEKLIDELTPYYQARLSWLSPQQREIVEFLCKCGNAVSVKEIASSLLITHQTATGQLKDLKDKGYVQGHTLGREARYELAEPLMRLSVEVKENQRQPIRLIIDFLRIWHSREQLESRLRSMPAEFEIERKYVEYALHEVDDSWTKSMLSELGHYPESDGNQESIAFLECLAQNSGQVSDWMNLGLAHRAGNCNEAALEAFDHALALEPNEVRALRERGVVLTILGQYEEALKSFDRAIAAEPENASMWVRRGVTLGILGRHEAALESLERSVAIPPDGELAWIRQGLAFHLLRRNEEALESFDKALTLRPDRAVTWEMRGEVLRTLGRHVPALESIDRAVAIQPDDPSGWTRRASVLLDLEEYEAALESFDRAVAVRPDDAYVWGKRGAVLRILGRQAEALESFDRAIAIQPEDVDNWLGRGMVLTLLGLFNEALESFDRSLAVKPDDARALGCRGAVLYILDRHEEALKSFDRAVALQPNNALTWYGKGANLAILGKHQQALESYDRALSIEPDYAVAAYRRIPAIMQIGRWDEAFAELGVCLRRFRPQDGQLTVDAGSQVAAIFTSPGDESSRRDRVRCLVHAFADAGALTYLGTGLIRSLALIRSRTPSASSLSSWRQAWNEVGADRDELRIPLRIFDVGISFLLSGDRRVFLDLVQEEREILVQALGLEPQQG